MSEDRVTMAAQVRLWADELRRAATEADSLAANLDGQSASPVVVTLASRAEPTYAAVARRILKDRRKVTDFFEPDMFADPARDILLDLFAAAEEGESVSVSSCCIAASVPQTTALRWLDRLKQTGLVTQTEDAADRRRRFVALTPKGHDAMRRYLASISRVLPQT